MKIEHIINTDVLVIGGGVAATRAALSSAQSEAKTTMVLKKELGKSGSTNWPRKGTRPTEGNCGSSPAGKRRIHYPYGCRRTQRRRFTF